MDLLEMDYLRQSIREQGQRNLKVELWQEGKGAISLVYAMQRIFDIRSVATMHKITWVRLLHCTEGRERADPFSKSVVRYPVLAPKGLNKSAQGNALGLHTDPTPSPERVKQTFNPKYIFHRIGSCAVENNARNSS